MAMTERQNLMDSSERPRRLRHESGPNYNGEGNRSLELTDIIEVLNAYHDYEGGINCSLCGKLYKSKVCFIKHLWEHSVYWDKFDGAKNHERVLSIQAALILCGPLKSSGEGSELVSDLLVTSPHGNPNNQENVIATPKKETFGKRQLSPLKVPKTPRKKPRITDVPKRRPKLADM